MADSDDRNTAAGAVTPEIAAVLGVVGCGCAVVGHGGVVLYANEALAALLGRRVPTRLEVPADTLAGHAEYPLPGGGIAVLTVRALPVADGRLLRLVTLVDQSSVREAEERAHEHLATVTKLSDTAIQQAQSLKDYSERLEDRVRDRTLDVMRQNAQLVARARQLEESRLSALQMLAVACEAKDDTTGAHVVRIGQGTSRVAERLGLTGMDGLEDESGSGITLGQAAVLHDVGKLHVADAVLTKPGPLTEEEWGQMRQHTTWGERILEGGGPEFEVARKIARHHHENFDGTGYPDRMRGHAIPLAARIVRVVDAVDALASDRPYKKAWSWREVLGHLKEQSGKAFDPEVVKVADELIKTGCWPGPRGESGGGDASEIGLAESGLA